MKMGYNTTVYGGSDGNLYYKVGNKFFMIEPIKWRVLSRDENNIAVLLAENILDRSIYGEGENEGIYTYSYIHRFLINDFFSEAFTESAQDLINYIDIDSDTIDYFLYFHFDEYSRDKIYLLKDSELFDSILFPDNSSRTRSYTGLSAYKCNSSQGSIGWWWLRSSRYKMQSINHLAATVNYVGEFYEYNTREIIGGIVPALSIYLPPAD
jgi:hypothetical protein